MSNSASPIVSACIPVYNGAGFIAKTGASVSVQSFRDFERIIRDNTATDDTSSILSRFIDTRLRMWFKRILSEVPRKNTGNILSDD